MENGNQKRLILVVDTDSGVRWSLKKGLTKSGYDVRTAATVEQAVHVAQLEPVSAILLELMPEAGLTVSVLSSLLRAPSSPKIVCSSIKAAPPTVIDCMRRGASDFLVKPFSLGQVRDAFTKVFPAKTRAGETEEWAEEEPDTASSLLVGVSPPMRELRATLRQIAKTNLNCLIRGQSGSGKDVVAREIHRLSGRSNQPFIKVNCSALPEQLLESELFGYEKGAFTGAVTSKPGRFSLADNGIIFLDEIGEVPSSLQAKLLQVIEHKEFTRLGGRATCKVDVHIVVATNADLEEKTKNGEFRQDLFFRLNEVCIWVPPSPSAKKMSPSSSATSSRNTATFSATCPSRSLAKTSPNYAKNNGTETSANSRAPSSVGSCLDTIHTPKPPPSPPSRPRPIPPNQKTTKNKANPAPTKYGTPSKTTNGTAEKPPTLSA